MVEAYREKVLSLSDTHSFEDGFNGSFGDYRIRKVTEAVKLLPECGSVLEIGCGEGRMTEALSKIFDRVVVVEPSTSFLSKTVTRVSGVKSHNCFFEDFQVKERFDCVIATGVLEHVLDVGRFLSGVKKCMRNDSLFVVTVPNAGSLHRRIGQKMGIIRSLDELGELDKKVGHYRYYDFQSLVAEFASNGMQVVTLGGIFLKPVPFSDFGKFTQGTIEALFLLGDSYPELCAEIFVVARRAL